MIPSPRDNRSFAAWLAFPVASLLVLAAVLKLSTALGVFGAAAAAGSDSVSIAASVLEIPLALCLVLYRRRAAAWFVAALLFGAFTGYALLQWRLGRVSCGCFGALQVQPALTAALDAVVTASCVVAALSLSRLQHGPWGAAALNGAPLFTLSALGVGSVFTQPAPAPTAPDAPIHRLLARPELAEVASDTPAGPAWLVYVYNTECEICLEHLTAFRAFQSLPGTSDLYRLHEELWDSYEDDPDASLRINKWSWGTPPAVFLVQRGQVTKSWTGYDWVTPGLAPSPSSLARDLLAFPSEGDPDDAALQHLLADPFSSLLKTPQLRAVAEQQDASPARWLVYIYNAHCPDCSATAAAYASAQSQLEAQADPSLRVLTLTTESLVNAGLPGWIWPGSRQRTYAVQGRRVIRIYPDDAVPDPFEYWLEHSGK